MKLQKLSEFDELKWYEFSFVLNERMISIMARKKDSQITAYRNFCPHQGRRLDYIQGQFLISDTDTIICPAHGAEFSADSGECFNGPCKGQSLKRIDTLLKNDEVYAILEE